MGREGERETEREGEREGERENEREREREVKISIQLPTSAYYRQLLNILIQFFHLAHQAPSQSQTSQI